MTIGGLLRKASRDQLQRVARAHDEEWGEYVGLDLTTGARGPLGFLEDQCRGFMGEAHRLDPLPLAPAARVAVHVAWTRLVDRLGLPGASGAIRRSAKRRLGAPAP